MSLHSITFKSSIIFLLSFYVGLLQGQDANSGQNPTGVSHDFKRSVSSESHLIHVINPETKRPLKTLSEHTGKVLCLKYFPTGSKFVSGGRDRSIILWDENYNPTQRKSAHDGFIWCLVVDPDEQKIFSGGGDGKIKAWKAHNLSPVYTLSGHTGSVNALAVSTTGRLASSGSDNTVKVWDTKTGTLQFELEVPIQNSEIITLSFNPKGTKLVGGGHDGTVYFWDIKSRSLVKKTEDAHQGWVNAVHYRPNGRTFVSGGLDGTIRVWDGFTSRLINTISHPSTSSEAQISDLLFSNDGFYLAETSSDKNIRIWDFNNQRVNQVIQDHSVEVSSYDPQGNRMVSVGDKEIKVWSTKLSKEHRPTVLDIKPIPKTHLIATIDDLGFLKYWNTKRVLPVKKIKAHQGSANTMDVDPYTGDVVTGGEDGRVIRWNSNGFDMLSTTQVDEVAINIVKYHPKGSILCATDNFEVKVISQRGEILKTLSFFNSGITALDISKDGNLATGASDDGRIIVWNFHTDEIVSEVSEPINIPYNIRFLSKNKLITSGYDGVLRVWSLQSNKIIKRRSIGGQSILAMTLSKDRKRVVISCADKKIRIWDISRNKITKSFDVSFNLIYGLSFAGSGKLLITGAYKDELKVVEW